MLKAMTPIAVMICSVSVAFAQKTDERVNSLYDNLDKNGDGLLTRDEFDNNESEIRLFERFLQLYDKDGDKKLTKDEYLKAFETSEPPQEESKPAEPPDAPDSTSRQRGMDAAAIFSRLDNNRDGKLELKELPRPLRERLGPTYKTLEKDSLTVEEFVPAFRALFAERREEAGLPSAEALFGHLDKNQDDKLTIDEIPEQFRPRLKQLFDRFDTEFITKADYAGLLERSRREDSDDRPEERRNTARDDERRRPEFMRRPPGDEPGPPFFGMLDNDRDGKLSGNELSQAPQLVARLDRNEDGLLAPVELFGFARRRADRDGRSGPPGRGRPETADRPVDRPDRPQRPPLTKEPKATAESPMPENTPPRTNLRDASNAEFADRLFVQFDENQDGKLSSEEAPGRLRRSFDRLDLDGDGAVSKEELTNGLAGPTR